MPAHYREIWHEQQFSRELHDLEASIRRADEFLKGADWILCRYPEAGTKISDSPPVWFLPIVDIPGLPSIAIYYTFDDENVWYLSIQATDSL